MSYFGLIYGSGVFFGCLMLHILIWRNVTIKRHAMGLMGIFIGAGFTLIGIVAFVLPLSTIQMLEVTLFHFSLSSGYILLYPACQAKSPSVTILCGLMESMDEGLSEGEIANLLGKDSILEQRVDDVVSADLVQDNKGHLSLTPKGKRFIFPFILFRRSLGLPFGNG